MIKTNRFNVKVGSLHLFANYVGLGIKWGEGVIRNKWLSRFKRNRSLFLIPN